jgi:uncharacterized protein (TIGR03437 family)
MSIRILVLLLFVTLGLPGLAQTPTPRWQVVTIAGGQWVGDGGNALSAIFSQPEGLAVDASGALWISDPADHRVRKITGGLVTTEAGDGTPGFSGDGSIRSASKLNSPYGLAVDAVGQLYIADLGNGRVRRIGSDGKLTTVAGGGTRVPTETGNVPALELKLEAPRNVLVDRSGSLYISDFGAHRVYRVGADGNASVFAGAGTAGFAGDGGLAARAQLRFPCGLAMDRQGALYITDSGNRRVRKVYQAIIGSVGELGLTGTNALGLATPTGIAIDGSDNLFIADGRLSLTRIAATGAVTLIAPGGSSVVVDGAGALYLTRQGSRVVTRVVNGNAQVYAGMISVPDLPGDGGPSTNAQLRTPSFLSLDGSGNLAFADTFTGRVRLIDTAGVIKSVAGTGKPPGDIDPVPGPANATPVMRASGVAWDSKGNLYFSDLGAHRIWRVDSKGLARVAAGSSQADFRGDGGPAEQALLSAPAGLAVGADGSLYFADSGNARIRRIAPSGLIFTVAGGGQGKPGEEGIATGIALEEPFGVAVDREGNLYFSETAGNRVRMVNLLGHMVTLADAKSGDLKYPRGVSLDSSGALWIADSGNHRLRTIDLQGTIRTVAGTGSRGFSGDGGEAGAAEFDTPLAMAIAPDGTVFVSDSGNHRIRRLKLTREPAPPPIVEPTPPGPNPPNPNPPNPNPPNPSPPNPTPPPNSGQGASIAVVHGAILRELPIAPGQVVSIFGKGLGPAAGINGKLVNGRMESLVAGVEVRFDNVPAPLLYVSDSQINLQVPHFVVTRVRTEVKVIRDGTVVGSTTVAVREVVPGILTAAGGGQAIAAMEGNQLNGPQAGVKPGSVLTFYITGDGQFGATGADGRPAAGAVPTTASVSVDLGGYSGEVLYAGAAPGMIGIMQVNIRVSAATKLKGALPLTARVNGVPTQEGVFVFVQ